MNTRLISIDWIQPNRRLSYANEEIEHFYTMIRSRGQSEPITVFFDGEYFRIIDGEKRWRACKRLGMSHVSAVINEAPSLF